jgi:flagellar hook-length control protein FliK
VTVAPDALGPVTVRAHVSATGMQVEMFAASDAARDAVRAIIPDLRRDMGGAGLQVGIDLSSQNQPSDPRGQNAAQNAFQNANGNGTGPGPGADASAARDPSRTPLDPGDGPQHATDPTRASLTTTSLDVLA